MARPNRIPEIAAARNTTPDEMVLAALRQHKSVFRAAESIGVSFQSLWDYVNNPQPDKTKKPRFKKTCTWSAIDTIDAQVIE
jgi:hypothetical protein